VVIIIGFATIESWLSKYEEQFRSILSYNSAFLPVLQEPEAVLNYINEANLAKDSIKNTVAAKA
jgi:hypothetical protein